MVCPTIERLLSLPLEDKQGKEYLTIFDKFYLQERELFAKWNFDGLNEFARTFLLNNVFTQHGHKFIWSEDLMIKVLKLLGYRDVRICKIGKGHNDDYCIERRRRALYLGNNWEKDRSAGDVYDAESSVIEAIK